MKRYKLAIITAAVVGSFTKSPSWGVIAGLAADALLKAMGAPEELPSELGALAQTCGPLLARVMEE